MRLALRGNQRWRERDRTESNLREGDDRLRRDRRSTQAVSASVSVPLIGDANAAPWLRRLTTEISGEYSTGSDHSSEREGEFGLAWAPVKQLVFRANVSAETESASHLVDAQSETLVGETLVDPRHDSALVSDVQEIIRRISDVLPETSLRRSIGFTFEPERLRGLRLTARYDHRMRRHLFEDRFDLQDLINNEAGFPDRVQRAEPTAEDLAAGRPGRIVAVDVTPGSVGSAETSDIDFSLNYRVPSERLGRVQVAIEGTRLLESKREIAPGVSFLNEGDSRYHPPDWRARGSLSWAWKSWNTSLRVRYTGAIVATAIGGEIPAHTEVDWNMGYRFREGVWGSFGKGLRVTLGLDNVFDAAPAFADTIDGYRGGSPLGRTVSMAFTLPL